MTPPDRTYRLIRNIPAERYLFGRPEPFAPRYDVEEWDGDRIPIYSHATGLPAEAGRAVIARLVSSDR